MQRPQTMEADDPKLNCIAKINDICPPGAGAVGVEICEICGMTKRPFICADCINSGQFYRSSVRHIIGNSEIPGLRYSEYLEKVKLVEQEKTELISELQSTIQLEQEKEEKIVQLWILKRRIDSLKSQLKQKEENVANAKTRLKERQTAVQQSTKRIGKYDKKIRESSEKVKDRQNSLEDARLKIFDQNQLVSLRRRELIQQLVSFIFSIKEAESKSSEMTTTVHALSEARRMTYDGGKWSYASNSCDKHFHVVYPKLPGNGDYSAFASLGSQPAETTSDHLFSHALLAALMYCCQLTSAMAFILDVHLPFNLFFGDFGKAVNEANFRLLTNKLNYNILFLCFSQNVNAEQLHPNQTVLNLLALLETPQLGRTGYYDMSHELLMSLDKPLSLIDSAGSEEFDEDPKNYADDDDWENVSLDYNLPTSHSQGSPSRGLVFSAVSSLLRSVQK